MQARAGRGEADLRRRVWPVIGLVALSACARAAADPGAPPRPAGSAHAAQSPAVARPLRADGAGALELFRTRVAAHPDLDYPDLARRLALDGSPADAPLSFDPTSVAYFARVAEVLKLTDDERAIFQREGLVSVDHKQRLSMGTAYNAIYARDLPVLITSDSILHALHRSFDAALEELEVQWFAEAIADALAAAQDALVSEGRGQNGALTDSLRDVDLYFTVARNLFEGAGAPADDAARDVRPSWMGPPPKPAPRSDALPVEPRLETEATVRAVLARIATLKMDDPSGPCTALYGGKRCVDYSQFRPRGHYSKSPRLRAYFRALTWLGRADLGWNLREVDPRTSLAPLVERERRDAALAILALSASGRLTALAAVSGLVDFLVGASDNVTVNAFAAALSHAGIKKLADVGASDAPARIARALAAGGARGQQIASQVLVDPGSPNPTDLPLVLQLFGQRFVLDSFVESRVVYDTIVYKGEKQTRLMPSGLDVMAALGDGEAVRLLEPELGRFNYASNLLAARETVDAYGPSAWSESAYNSWLSALRALHDPAPAASQVPQAMRREAWRRKQLQTELASWTELSHDTILYSKQSYTIVKGCSYPVAYVEPVPTFYDRVGDPTRALAKRLEAAQAYDTDPQHTARYARTRDQLVALFARFADTTGKLATLARKELAARPFTREEADFLKKTIDIRGGGSGAPRYDGWYPKLILGAPAAWKPTVADVHTDPNSGDALEEAVGDAMFLVVAIDNREDRAAYVGPVYSYYELTARADRRMTDEEWQAMLSADRAPSRPAWTAAFAAPPVARELGP